MPGMSDDWRVTVDFDDEGDGTQLVEWLSARRLPLRTRFVMATALEAAWEVIENTPMVINRYREATIALDYYGDSVLNSIADIVAMMAGFWLASAAPARGARRARR